jgi:hypothetical protein
MARESKHYPNTTEYRDHGAPDHDHKTEWSKDDRGRLQQRDQHVPKGEGGYVTQKVGNAKRK